MRMTVRSLLAARMRARIGLEKLPSILMREMADLENGRQMRRRNRHRIGRIADLRNEGAVLAECDGKALTRSRWAVLEHAPQDILVVGNGGGRSRADFIIHRFRPACAGAPAALQGVGQDRARRSTI